ncbi:MAG: thioredoxin domain-containing protein [Chitinophagaceae bacterium]
MFMIRFFLSLFFVVTIYSFSGNAQEKTSLNTKDFEKGINGTDVQILDVRTLAEYQSGHLQKALLADWNDPVQFKERVLFLNKTKPVYTYCLSGFRSKQAMEWMQKNGFEKVFNLDGGILAWKKAGMPVEALQEVKQITIEQYFAGIPADKTVLVDIGAVWCAPCQKMAPVIDSLTTSQEVSFILLKIEGGEQEELVKQLSVNALPTFIVYKKGKEVWRKQGIVGRQELIQQLQ